MSHVKSLTYYIDKKLSIISTSQTCDYCGEDSTVFVQVVGTNEDLYLCSDHYSYFKTLYDALR